MTKTEKIFQDAIRVSAEVVKMINEDGAEYEDVEKLNEEIAELESKLQDLSWDFDEIKNRKDYCKKVLGKDYFYDSRCWDYLTDVVYEIENNVGWNLQEK